MPNVSISHSLWTSLSKFKRSSRELRIKLTCPERTSLSFSELFMGPDSTHPNSVYTATGSSGLPLIVYPFWKKCTTSLSCISREVCPNVLIPSQLGESLSAARAEPLCRSRRSDDYLHRTNPNLPRFSSPANSSACCL